MIKMPAILTTLLLNGNPVRKVRALTPPSIRTNAFSFYHPQHKYRGFLTGKKEQLSAKQLNL